MKNVDSCARYFIKKKKILNKTMDVRKLVSIKYGEIIVEENNCFDFLNNSPSGKLFSSVSS